MIERSQISVLVGYILFSRFLVLYTKTANFATPRHRFLVVSHNLKPHACCMLFQLTRETFVERLTNSTEIWINLMIEVFI